MSLPQSTPLLAIVVPTRNRQEYVVSAVRSLLRIPSTEIEIVIEDNSDTPELQEWISKHVEDRRLTYHYSNVIVSQSENYDRSMRGATAEYIAFIGDDDSVNPDILEAVRWAKSQDVDALVPLNKAHFVWPDLQMSATGALAPGELSISPITSQMWTVDPEAELRKCLRDAGQDFHHLPRAYYGVVRKIILEKVRSKTGSYFPGVSPDLAAAIALANVAQRVLIMDYPLFLPGSSLRSNAGLSGQKRHVGMLNEQAHLGPDCDQNWSAVIPPFFSVQTIWAEAAIESLSAMEREDIINLFNVPKLYAWLIMFHPRFIRLIGTTYLSALRRTKRGFFKGTLELSAYFLKLAGLRFQCLIRRFTPKGRVENVYRRQGIKDIENAVSVLNDYLKKNALKKPWDIGFTKPAAMQH
jgi:glycosyltransferase involved in cell wall biosynthesis